jgi:hypothetical protein
MFLGDSYIPSSLGLVLEAAEPECTVAPCSVRSAVRATSGADSVVLTTDEAGQLGDLTIINDFYEPVDCPSSADAMDDFVIAGYTLP